MDRTIDALTAARAHLAGDRVYGYSNLLGTLSAIVNDPVAARPLPGVPDLLARLAARFGLVAVVSGRPTAFLAEVLQSPPGVTLVGLYGLERALQGPAHDADL